MDKYLIPVVCFYVHHLYDVLLYILSFYNFTLILLDCSLWFFWKLLESEKPLVLVMGWFCFILQVIR